MNGRKKRKETQRGEGPGKDASYTLNLVAADVRWRRPPAQRPIRLLTSAATHGDSLQIRQKFHEVSEVAFGEEAGEFGGHRGEAALAFGDVGDAQF